VINTTNFHSHEIRHFNAQAADWWDLSGPCEPLHRLNPLRSQFIQQHAPVYGLRVLDVGCGGGILAEQLSKFGASVVGIDLASDSIRVAQEHASTASLSIEYHCISLEAYAQSAPLPFDVITCMELLEHVPEPESIVKHIAQLLNPAGHVFFSTLSRTPKAFVQAIVGAEYLLKLLPKGTHQYATFIRPSELATTARLYSLTCQHVQGITYRPWRKQYVLTPDVRVNYLMHCEAS
jgi:2-polyprenyl-6-hydroxyphenyl methylase/3-demethylubiquinone-9 3-methyltransferase